jgi:pseudaminic acid synthase
MKMKINFKSFFNEKKPPKIVAEISSNHCGSKKLLLQHIKCASQAGADMVKIQTYEPQDITVDSRSKKFFLKKGLWKNKNLHSLYKKANTPFSWHKDAFKLAKKLKIILFSSPFSPRAVDFLEKLGNPIYKLASLEITDVNLIKKIAQTKKPIIISTGSSNLKEIKNCVKIIKQYHSKIIILHCVSKYPTLDEEANLKRLDILRKQFKKIPLGLSDHTNNIYSSIAATSKGVVLIEKHFKLNRKINSPDKAFSLIPDQFKDLKKFSLKIHKILNYKLQKNNYNSFQRRSIFAKRDIKKGEKFSEDNIVSLRPKIGICSSQFFSILNKSAIKSITANKPIYAKDTS